MRDDLTRIVIVLDRSGSMYTVRESTIAGLNTFIAEQRKAPGHAVVKLIQFDNIYEVVFDKPLDLVPELTQADFKPRGNTALNDAQGRTIVELGKELAAIAEDQRPGKVVVVTITDGLENCSALYTRNDVARMIKHQQDAYNWTFIYIGANQDAVREAASMNIPSYAAMRYTASSGGTRSMMMNTSNYTTRVRSGIGGQSAGFTEEERTTSMMGAVDTPATVTTTTTTVTPVITRAVPRIPKK